MFTSAYSRNGRHVAATRTYTAYNMPATTRSRAKKKTGFNLTYVLCMIACTLAMIMCIGAVVMMVRNGAEAADSDHPTIQTPAVTPSVESKPVDGIGDISDTTVPITPADDAVTTPVIDEPELMPITTTRLGVIVDTYNRDVDYSDAINEAFDMINEDGSNAEHILALCEIYEAQRNLKIIDGNYDYEVSDLFSSGRTYEEINAILNPFTPWIEHTEADIIKLAQIIYAEAGANWCTDYHQLCVGSVVLCRLVSDVWKGDTIYDIIHAPGQYPNTCNNTVYDQRCYDAAKYLLEYGPVVEADYQANFKQGAYVVEIFDYRDAGHSITYICHSGKI